MCSFAEGSRSFTYGWWDVENEIGKEKRKKMSSVFEQKHDAVIQQFVEEATMVNPI